MHVPFTARLLAHAKSTLLEKGDSNTLQCNCTLQLYYNQSVAGARAAGAAAATAAAAADVCPQGVSYLLCKLARLYDFR
jgi:hypothetical protein